MMNFSNRSFGAARPIFQRAVHPAQTTIITESYNMKTPTSYLIRCSSILALVLAIWSPLHAQTPAPANGKKMMMNDNMMKRCEEMKEKKAKMMTEMKAQDAELTAQVAQMNSAPDSEKLGLMASLLTHLTEQRIAMDAKKAKMEEEIMQHMMKHMQMGADSMAQCPMMKGMGEMDEKSDGSHQDHPGEPK